MSTTNYKLRLKNSLKRLAQTTLIDENIELSKSDERKLRAGKQTLETIQAALDLVNTDIERSFELLCELPYYMVNPGDHVADRRLAKDRIHVGSDALYGLTDTIRHYIRMIDIESGGQVGLGPNWNNVKLIG